MAGHRCAHMCTVSLGPLGRGGRPRSPSLTSVFQDGQWERTRRSSPRGQGPVGVIILPARQLLVAGGEVRPGIGRDPAGLAVEVVQQDEERDQVMDTNAVLM